MAKHTVFKAATVLIIVGLVSYLAWDNTKQVQPVQKRLLPAVTTYQTTSTRTSNLGKYCPSSVDRTTLVTTADISTATSNRKAVSTQLGIDGNKLMNNLAKGNTGDAMTMITSNAANIGMFIGAFLLPFIIFLWIWPFLCCCCCCPSCCPSKCCQKAQNELYTKCQLYWPAVTLILALLLVLSTSIYGFVSASNVGPSFTNMGCSLAIFTDDLLNGNVTSDNKTFFTGLYLFSNKLTDLNGNISTIETHLGDLNNTGSGTTYTQTQAVQTVNNNVKNIPDNAGTSNMAITYDTPINTAPTGTLASSYGSILGKWDTNTTLMYKLYNSILNAYTQMNILKISSNIFVSQKGTITTQLTPMKTNIDNLATNVKDMDSQLGGFLSLLKTPGDLGNMGMQGFYGFLICFSFFSLVGALLTVCCDKPGCRHLMYFSCMFLFLGAFIAFLVAVLFSFFVPFFTWTCDYINVAVSSDSGFKDNFGAFLSNTTVDQISVCMPYGDGKIVSKVAGSAANALNNLTSVITGLQSFNNTLLKSYITGNLTQLTNSVNAYANGDISDLDSANNEILRGLSYPSSTTYKTNCNTAFDTDSWVPSNNQDSSYSTAISCQVSSGIGNKVSCTPSLTNTVSNTCAGCMDTTQLLAQSASAAALRTALDGRYTSTCAFNPYLQNTWTNYFNKKFTVLGFPTVYTQTSGTVMYRLSQSTSSISGSAFTNIDNFKTHLNTAKAGLSGIGDLTDPTYGMLAGLNCKIFGQDFVTFQNVICGSFYNNMFIIRLTFGIAAWGILFSMCCIVCTGVRHFKQIDKLKKIGDNMAGQEIQQTKAELRAKN